MTTPPFARPFTADTFAAAAAAWPKRPPLLAAMRAMGSGPRPVFTAAELAARRDRELGFWAGLPGGAAVQARIRRRYAEAIAAAERRADRAERIRRIDAALDAADAALGPGDGLHRLQEAQQMAEVDRLVVPHAQMAAVRTNR